MCLALYKPVNIKPDYDKLRTAMQYNSDGAGFAVAHEGQLIVEKGFFKFDSFKKAFEPFEDCAAIVHFRIGTSGVKDKNNCHPFKLNDFEVADTGLVPVAVIHNGIFNDAASDKKEWNDTWHVCRDILHPLWRQNPFCFSDPHIIALGDKYVGSFNKLVFLDSTGKCSIWGESNGHWKDGVWYSNRSYEDWKVADPRHSYTGSKRNYGKLVNGAWQWDEDDDEEFKSWTKTTKYVNGKPVTTYSPPKRKYDQVSDTKDYGLGVGVKSEQKQIGYLPLSAEDADSQRADRMAKAIKEALSDEQAQKQAADELNEEAIEAELARRDAEQDIEDTEWEGSVINLDLELPAISRVAVDELRECGYTDCEIEDVWIEDRHAGLVKELLNVYGASGWNTHDANKWLLDESRKRGYDKVDQREDESMQQEMRLEMQQERREDFDFASVVSNEEDYNGTYAG